MKTKSKTLKALKIDISNKIDIFDISKINKTEILCADKKCLLKDINTKIDKFLITI